MSGIIISIVLGIAGIICTYFIARWQMKKNQIDHYFINSYDIGKGLTDDFPGFSLLYNNEVLSKNVKVLKGGFINIGRNDVGEDDKITDIKIIFPEGFVIKAVKVSSTECGLNVTSHFDEAKQNILTFSINGLIKSQECFEYTTILEVPENTGILFNHLRFEHRIKNTNICNTYIGHIGLYKEKHNKISSLFLTLCVMAIIIIAIYILIPASNNYISIRSFIAVFGIMIFYLGIPYMMNKVGKRGRIIKALSKKQNN